MLIDVIYVIHVIHIILVNSWHEFQEIELHATKRYFTNGKI